MKKSWIIIITLIGLIVVGGYIVFDNVFPKASPIKYPEIDNITSISIVEDNDVSTKIDQSDFEVILENIKVSRPTRKMSINDYPSVRPYYEVAIDTTEKEYRYFVYIEDGYVHIEIPYEGIYKSDQQFYDLILQNIND